MTDKPTDTEIDAFVQVCREKGMRELAIFQAVLDKWGQPAHSGGPVAWKHDCAALLTNDVELWIDTCPHCGKPRNAQQPGAAYGALTDERAAFEAWIKKDCGDLSTFGSGQNIHYSNSAVNNAWTGWKARAIEAEVRKADEQLIRQLVEALESARVWRCKEIHHVMWESQYTPAILAGRARLEQPC